LLDPPLPLPGAKTKLAFFRRSGCLVTGPQNTDVVGVDQSNRPPIAPVEFASVVPASQAREQLSHNCNMNGNERAKTKG